MANYQDYLFANIPILRRALAQNQPAKLPSGGSVPQSAMTKAQLVSRGPGYGNQAMRVATAPPVAPVQPPQTGYGGTTPGSVPVTPGDAAADAERKKIIAAAVIARLMANPSQGTVAQPPQVNPNAVIPPNVEGASMANSFNEADAMNMTSVPFFRGIANAVTNPGESANAVGNVLSKGAEKVVMTPLKAAINHVPFFGAAVNELNKPFQWNIGEVGQSVYEVANGQKSTNQAIGGVNLNPTYYLVEPWAADPANKDAINSIYADGLDLNGDGQSDVTGGEAVMMYYFAKEHPGFIDNLVASMGFDPLFYGSMVAPVAGALQEGAQVGREVAATAGLSKTERILAAADRTLSGVTKAGEAANKVADLPIEGPLWLAGQAISRAPEGVQRFVNWAKAPVASTVERRTANEAADAADEALNASVVPSYVTNPSPIRVNPYALPERSVTNEADFVGTPYGVAPTSQKVSYPNLAAPALPERSTYPDFIVSATGEVIPNTTTKRIPDSTGSVPAVIDAAPPVKEIPIRRSNANGVPTTYVGIDGNVRVVARDSGVYELQKKMPYGKTYRWETVKGYTGKLAESDAVEGGRQLVSIGMDAGQPSTPTTPSPLDATKGMTRKERSAAIKRGEITSLDPYQGQQRMVDIAAEDAARRPENYQSFMQVYAPKRDAYLERAKWVDQHYYPNFTQKITDQVVGGIDHVVSDVAPAFKDAYGYLPEIEPTSTRKVMPTKSGKASYREENLPYLLERYVYSSSERDAAAILETLRKRPDIANAPWSDDLIQRVTEIRSQLRVLRGETFQPNLHTIGIVPPEFQALNGLIDRIKQILPEKAGPATVPPPHDFSIDDLGMRDHFLIDNELDIQVARGAIPESTRDFLKRPATEYSARLKGNQLAKDGTWTRVSEDQFQKLADRQGYSVSANVSFTGETLRARTATSLDELIAVMRENPGATNGEISQAFAERMVDLTGPGHTPRVPMRRSIERARSLVSGVSSSGRSIALYNPVTGIRGITGDVTSDSLRMGLEGHLGAAISSLTPVDYVRRAMGKPSELESVLQAYGRDLPNEIKITRGRTEIEGTGRTPTNKAVSGAIGFKEGSKADRVTGALTGAVDNKLIRDARNGSDNVRREAVALSEIQKREGRMLRSFNERGKAWAEKHDILPTSYQAYVDELGNRFTAEQLRTQMIELGRDAQIPSEQIMTFADRLARDWTHATDQMVKAADAEQKRVLFSYERTNLDAALGNVIFFHYWMTRAIPAYARIALHNPHIAAMWVRAWKDIQDRGEREGYPKSLQSFVRFMGSTDGFYGLWNPLNVILPVADMAPDAMAEGWYEQLTQFIFLSPMIRSAFSVLGVDSQATDPLNTYAIRSMAMAIVNKIRAETGKAGPARDPFEALLRRGYEIANAVVAKTGLPGTQQRQFLDPMTFQVSEIRYVVADLIEKQTGIPKDQWGPEQWTLWEQAIADGEAGIENPLYQQAFQQWADAKLEGRVLNSLVPGGVRTRFGPRDALMAGDLTDEESHAKNLLNSGSADDAKLDILNDQYHAIGNERQQALAKGYNDILHVDNRMRTANQYANDQVLVIGGDSFTVSDVAKLDEDSRRELAKAWVASHNGTDELTAYWDKRDQWVTEHPEYGAFDAYKDVAYNYTGGVRQFRLDRAAGNPNFKRAMDERRDYLLEQGTDKSLIESELDAWATSLAAYKAAQGIKDYIYDPNPVSTGDQSTVDSVVRSLSSTQQGGAGSFAGKKSTADKLNADITKYEKDRKVLEGIMEKYGVDPVVLDSTNEIATDMVDRMFGDLVPTQTTLMKQYYAWKAVQPKGTDTSVEAFTAYLDSLAQDAAA